MYATQVGIDNPITDAMVIATLATSRIVLIYSTQFCTLTKILLKKFFIMFQLTNVKI
jgi:hypothetical protein